jgi:hypothetical protein
VDILLVFAYSWRRRCRERLASPIRDSVPHTRIHHVEFLGARNHFAALISAFTTDSPARVDRPNLSRCNAYSVRTLTQPGRRFESGSHGCQRQSVCGRKQTTANLRIEEQEPAETLRPPVRSRLDHGASGLVTKAFYASSSGLPVPTRRC